MDLDLLIRDPSPCRLSPMPPEEDARASEGLTRANRPLDALMR
ncbi:MAG: hypothetical protein VKO00_08330 [Cyanobacteriota bacterium]|nr:hypothetical protein [Cyanobacteriota bacterium]